MTDGQRAALFWTFLVLFVAIVIVSLLVAMRFGPFDDAAPAFQNVAVGTIIAGLVGAVITAYRTSFTGQTEQFITLDFQGAPVEDIDLEHSGTYEVWNVRRGAVEATGTIMVELVQGGWICRLPKSVGRDDRIRLLLRERTGAEWEVRFFSLNFNKQPVVRR